MKGSQCVVVNGPQGPPGGVGATGSTGPTGPPISIPQTIVERTTILGAPILMAANQTTQITNITMLMPASGGPWRVLGSYMVALFGSGTAAIPVSTWIFDLNNGVDWGGSQVFLYPSHNSGTTMSAVGPLIYNNSQVVQFQLFAANGPSVGSTTVSITANNTTPTYTYLEIACFRA